jgi:uncharacterized protein (DUF1330 family)
MFVLALLTAGDGGIEALRAYERLALAILADHGGRLIKAFAPEPAPGATGPDEIHLLELPSAQALAAYRADPRLAGLAPARARAIAATTVYVGTGQIIY